MGLEIGNAAPDFVLPTDGAGTIALKDLRQKPVVLYFYPKDNTSGCTQEAIDFRDNMEKFAAHDVTVVGISKDSVKKHDNFKAKHQLNFSLASDESTDVCEQYGVWVEKKMYGNTYWGIERTTFLIGADGKIVKIWPKVKVKGHADEVLAALNALI